MSRVIENDHLWDEDEVAYKEARNLTDEVEANRAKFGGKTVEAQEVTLSVEAQEVTLSDEVIEFVKNLDDEQVKSALESRDLKTEGSAKELKFALAQAIQAEKDAS